MTEREEVIKSMVIENNRNRALYSDPFELAAHVADMHDLWEPSSDDHSGDLPDWLVDEAEDIWHGNY